MNDQNQSINSNLQNQHDEKPIGHTIKFSIPEYAENQNPAMIPEVSAPPPKLPLIKRLQSNALKTKKQALEELLLLVKESVGEFKQYEELTIDLLSYSHPSVVDRILKIVLLYFQGGQQLGVDQKAVIKTVIEKCLASDKAEKEDIKKSSEEVLFWYMDHKYEDVLLNELNEGLINKNHKIVATSLLFIANLLNNYGIKRMKNLERFSKHLDLLSLPPKSTVKAQTIEFYKEVYRWMGENTLKDFKIHTDLKDEIVKFGKEYQSVPMAIKRGIKKEAIGDGSKTTYRMDEQSQNQEEVDVLSNYTSKWVDDTLEIVKWKDKKDALDEFIKKTRVSKILPPRDVSHYITLIKRLLAENNINLLLCGFSITQNLSKGLKRHFFIVAKNISPNIFLKLKDAKSSIVQAAQETLKSLLHSLNLDQLMEEIKASLDDKAPMMRMQTLRFLGNFATKKQPKVMNLLRTLLEKFVRLTEDGAEPVRKQALELLCNLKKAHGMKYFGDKLKNLDSKKMTVIQMAKPAEGLEMMDIEVHTQGNISNNSMNDIIRENSKMQIQEKVEDKEYKELEKIATKSMGSCAMKQEQPSVQSNIPPRTMKTVSSKTLNDLISQNESIRFNAYQEILAKTSYNDLKPLMFTIKSNAIRQSAPNNLKLVVQLAKKYAGVQPIDLETLEYIYKHDWKKAKLTLNDFLTSNKFTPQASDYIRHNNISISNSKVNNSVPQAAIQQTNLKSFMKQLEFLLTKMTNPIPQIRIESANHAIRFLQPLPIVANEADLTPTNGWNQDCITKFCGMVRFRLNECDEVASVYSELLKIMIHKGILTRNKGLKQIIQTIFLKLKEKKLFIKQIFEEIANNSPQFLFSTILGELVRQPNEPLIEFIIENNELFIRNAQVKMYICPFLQLIFQSDISINLKTELKKILDQIIELNGENVLQAEIKKIKLTNPNVEQYLAKYNISMNMPSFGAKSINFKNDRLKMDEDNPWPIFAAPSHVLKLINQLISLKEPLPTLANPLGLTQANIALAMQLDNVFLAEYSDLLLKWVYWRTVIDRIEVMPDIIKFAYKIIIAVNDYLSQPEFTVLLSSMINVLERFKGEYIQLVGELLRSIFDMATVYKERSLLFWINLLIKEQNTRTLPVNEILKLLTTCYSSEALTQHLTTLARSPQVLKNESFLRFLSQHFDHQFLTASGFRALNFQRQNKPTAELKPLLSDMGGPENVINITPQEKRYYITLFQKHNSIDLEREIKEINKPIDSSTLVDTHMKIIYSIVVPFMKKEIPVINVFTYFRELARLFNFSEGLKYSHCLKDLTRMLMYFLIDLDDNSIDNKDEITKTVNKIILFILEKSESRHMLEVLVILIDYQLKLNININSKIQHLIYKCIGKVSKFPRFQQRWQDNLLYIVMQTNNLFNKHEIKIDHPLIKTIKAIWKNDIVANTTYFTFADNYIQTHAINPTFLQVFNDVSTNTENVAAKEEGREKDMRNESNPIKSITAGIVNKLIAIKKPDNS